MSKQTFDLGAAAYAEMIKNGFHPDFPAGTDAQIAAIRAEEDARAASNGQPSAQERDLRALYWSSIDNDTSRDLDQAEWVERVTDISTSLKPTRSTSLRVGVSGPPENSDSKNGGIRVRVAIANVAAAVEKGSPIDRHASQQTKTVYTATRNFPMLPNQLSTDLTSLNQNEDRAAVVTEYVVDAQGGLSGHNIYRATVQNHAQLAYSRVGPWLEGKNPLDVKIAGSAELQEQLRLQDEAAQARRARRIADGAVDFLRVEADPLVVDGRITEIHEAMHNRATELIEEFMIGANETMAETLRGAGRSCIQRVVRTPQRWDRIVELAERYGTKLPGEADSGAMNAFLQTQRKADPTHYPDLSLAVIKLMGPGEYVLIAGDDKATVGHFGLAAHDYTHSTAPNRRFADLVMQRLIEAVIDGLPAPYTDDELRSIAAQCTAQEKAGRKVERTMQKRAAAVALADQIGRKFRGVVTGASAKGTYVRVFNPPVEGRMVQGEKGLDVGDTVNAKLLHTNPQMAYIDFGRV